MSKVFQASFDGSKVLYSGYEVPNCEVVSEGKGASNGLLFISEGRVFYVASSALDIKSTLEKLSSVLTEVVASLTTLDNKPVGGTGSAPAPALATNIANINALKSEIDILKGGLI